MMTKKELRKLQKEVDQLSNKTYKNLNKKTPEQLKAEWIAVEIHLETIINFGKHKGLKIIEICDKDFGWILWAFKNKIICLDKSDKGLEYFTRTYISNKNEEYKQSKFNK